MPMSVSALSSARRREIATTRGLLVGQLRFGGFGGTVGGAKPWGAGKHHSMLQQPACPKFWGPGGPGGPGAHGSLLDPGSPMFDGCTITPPRCCC